MLCIDCMVEDLKDTEAVSIMNGFALCRKHVDRLVMRIRRQNKESNLSCDRYLNSLEPEGLPDASAPIE